MPDFKKLEETHTRTPVTIDTPGLAGTGVLSLAGNKTEAHLVMPYPFGLSADESVWFDLRLKSGRGESIFLRNALLRSSTRSGVNREEAEASIFPNFVAFGAHHLTEDGKLNKISFRLKGLRDFFHYQMIEFQHLHKITPEIRNALKKIRTLEKKYPRNYEFFHPDELWLIHRMPRVLRFPISDRTYEIHMGFTETVSWSSPSIEVYPTATITFKNAVTIDEAFSHAWDWRRFFLQIAMEQLPFESISARASRRPRGYASLYLPNLRERSPESHRYSFYPGLAPFNEWKDRRHLARLMQLWLEKSPGRRSFRADLERVIGEMQERSTPDHVLTLAAAIESLPELDSASPYSKKDVKTLVAGAAAAAKEAGIDIETERLQGLLGMLRKQNLSRRLKLLGNTVAPFLSTDHEAVLAAVQTIRNARAHGSTGIGRMTPKVSATTRALAAMCALWDLKTSGMPFEKLGKKLVAQHIAVDEINHLKGQEPQ